MTINNNQSINSTGNPNGGVPTKRALKNTLSPDDFMKLFLTQIRNQDPLKPLDNSALMQQMSQMTSISATQNLEKTVKSLNNNLGKSQVIQAAQLVNRKVQLPYDKSPLKAGDLSGSVLLPGPATGIVVDILDSNNKVVKTIKCGDTQTGGVVDFNWDGLDKDGKPMAEDFYKISATAEMNGQTTKAMTAGTFKVTSVTLNPKDGGVILNLDGYGGTDMNQIIKII